jgi:RNA recognition motif-containing protein
MGQRLYCGNLPWAAGEQELKTFFAGFNISNVKIVLDRDTQRPKGYAFLDIDGDAQTAITALDDQQMGGRRIRVNFAVDKPRTGSTTNRKPPPKTKDDEDYGVAWAAGSRD